MVRPWALAGPILILLIAVPLSRPIRHPAFENMSDDEQARLATVQSLVERHSLAIEKSIFSPSPRSTLHVGPHTYSDQPPLLSLLLAVPYWVLYHCGVTFERNPLWVMFLLTLVGVCLPVALASGLIYKMGRLFELPRHWRAALGVAVVLGSGLISYSTVINAHASAAVLLLAAVACIFHVAFVRDLTFAASWLGLGGLCAAAAAMIDPPALLFLVLFAGVIASFRWPLVVRSAGILLYLLGATVPIAAHVAMARPITGSVLPSVYPSHADTMARKLQPILEDDGEDEAPAGFWSSLGRTIDRVSEGLFGGHGVFSHFPVLIIGLAGIGMVMHRHWPSATKGLAAATVAGGVGVLLLFALSRADWSNAMFATRWYVVFLPLLLFWSGAWLRRPHSRLAWSVVGVLLAFSVTVSLIGATGPWPREGFDRYTAAGAVINLVNPPPPLASQPLLARR